MTFRTLFSLDSTLDMLSYASQTSTGLRFAAIMGIFAVEKGLNSRCQGLKNGQEANLDAIALILSELNKTCAGSWSLRMIRR